MVRESLKLKDLEHLKKVLLLRVELIESYHQLFKDDNWLKENLYTLMEAVILYPELCDDYSFWYKQISELRFNYPSLLAQSNRLIVILNRLRQFDMSYLDYAEENVSRRFSSCDNYFFGISYFRLAQMDYYNLENLLSFDFSHQRDDHPFDLFASYNHFLLKYSYLFSSLIPKMDCRLYFSNPKEKCQIANPNSASSYLFYRKSAKQLSLRYEQLSRRSELVKNCKNSSNF